ncbi:hypothetical protein G9A89_020544 [Geosiphon pyriformis]|nr:hypothetical protein G9A89_020544 [Geosiphon pyriformis]
MISTENLLENLQMESRKTRALAAELEYRLFSAQSFGRVKSYVKEQRYVQLFA